MATRLPASADYVIVGGGTSGLVLAARLSEDPNVQIIVLESGPDRRSDPRVTNPLAHLGLSGSDLDWKPQIEPQDTINNRTLDHPVGKVLGGSSAINGLILTPPSPAGIDAWARLGNPDWKWASFKPYLERSLAVPGLTGDGPIKTINPALLDGKNNTLAEAWNAAHAEHGFYPAEDFLGEGKTVGVRPFTATIDPASGNRSAAANTYGTIAAARPNVTIVTEATVRRVLFESQGGNVTATGVEYEHNGLTTTVGTTNEVILAAGAFHTPKILELSGIGDTGRLESLGIPVVLNQPGVGENLQNHPMAIIPVALKKIPALMNVKPGIQALAYRQLNAKDISEALTDSPESISTHYQVARSLLQSSDEASAYSLISILPNNVALVVVMVTFPFSRGSVHISSSNPDSQPKIDPRIFSNDIDLDLLARHVQLTQEILSSSALGQFFLATPDLGDLDSVRTRLRESLASSAHHACGTAAMLPREEGGVVGQDLKVYGTSNLRIVDASVFPLIPHANPIATVYGVAERASDIIKGTV
ncbi:GMC family oxidoreductase [Aspergillus undulatus]|uniref:GMC family oxidoreductase n=1 Tax=Aspergillus undulatus TaxID=1810928 RepID=UPI003CCD5D20